MEARKRRLAGEFEEYELAHLGEQWGKEVEEVRKSKVVAEKAAGMQQEK